MNSIFIFKNISFINIFFCIFLVSLVSGPLIPELLILILIVNFLIKEKINSLFSSVLKNFFVFLIIFYFYININSLLFSNDVAISVKSTLPYIRLIIFSFLISKILIDNNKNNLIKLIIYSSLIMFFILLLDSSLQLITGKNILGFDYRNGRISSFFGSEQIMGSYIARVLPIIICFLYFLNQKTKKYFFVVFLILSLILIVLSSERIALAQFLFLVTVFIFIEAKSFKRFLSFFFIFLTILILSINFYGPGKNRIKDATLEQISGSTTILAPSYRHELHYINALYIFFDNYLLGTGIKSFRRVCSEYDKKIQKKIIEDKSIYSPYDGIFFDLMIPNSTTVLMVVKKLNENLSVPFLPESQGWTLKGHLLKKNTNLKNGQFIKKGEFIFAANNYITGCNTHPHNVFLQFLAELGLLGLVFYLIIFSYFFMKIFKIFLLKLKNYEINYIDKSIFMICNSIFIEIFPLLPSGNFFNNWISMIFFFKLGIFFFLIEKKIRK